MFLHSFAVLNLFGHHPIVLHHFPTIITPTPSIAGKILTATTDISQLGKTIHLKATFPASGGIVTGSVSGDCTGQIKGFYAGDTNGKKLQGKAYASCPILFFTLEGVATFNGTVNDTDTSAAVDYTVVVDHGSQTGSTTFSLTSQ